MAIRLLVSVNLLYAAVFAKFAGVPQRVAQFTADVASGPQVGVSARISADAVKQFGPVRRNSEFRDPAFPVYPRALLLWGR